MSNWFYFVQKKNESLAYGETHNSEVNWGIFFINGLTMFPWI